MNLLLYFTTPSLQVILPTGTTVEIKFLMWPFYDNWQLNIDIFPSPSDEENSSGLCGILDGTYKNDFTRSDGTVDNPEHYSYENPPNDFSESWRYVHCHKFSYFLKNYSSYVIETIYTGVLLIAVLFSLKRYIHVRIKL